MTQEEEADDRAYRAASWADFRKHLVLADQKSQEDFDKTVLSLSGGALGISFVFLKDVIGPNPIQSPCLLFTAWVAWGISAFCVLASYYISHLAIRKMINEIDIDTLLKEKPGGHYQAVTASMNAAGAVFFLVGVFSITLFAYANLKTKGAPDVRIQAVSPTPANAASAATPAASDSAAGDSPTKR